MKYVNRFFIFRIMAAFMCVIIGMTYTVQPVMAQQPSQPKWGEVVLGQQPWGSPAKLEQLREDSGLAKNIQFAWGLTYDQRFSLLKALMDGQWETHQAQEFAALQDFWGQGIRARHVVLQVPPRYAKTPAYTWRDPQTGETFVLFSATRNLAINWREPALQVQLALNSKPLVAQVAVQPPPNTRAQPLPAQAPQNQEPLVKVGNIALLPPVPGQPPQLTNGQILVASQEIYETPVNGSFVSAMKEAKSRAEQEAVVIRFIDPEMLERFRVANANSEGLLKPEDVPPMTDEAKALEIAAVKQPFVNFSQWGESPFGPKVEKWQDLRDSYMDTMVAMIQRFTFPPEMKAEWVDTLEGVFRDGLDGRYTKVDDARNWPLWQVTTGRAAPTPESGSQKGVNVRYTGGSSKVLALFLRKSGIWVLHGFDCHGNPIVPFAGLYEFTVTKQIITPQPPPPAQTVCRLEVNGALFNPNRPLMLKPEELVVFTGSAVGDTTKLQLQAQWLVQGQVEIPSHDYAGPEQYRFGPELTNYMARRYEGMFSLTDQLGRRTDCPFFVEVRREAPPQVTVNQPPPQPPREEPPAKKGHKARNVAIVVGAAGAAAAACYFLGCFGAAKAIAKVAGKPGSGTPGLIGVHP